MARTQRKAAQKATKYTDDADFDPDNDEVGDGASASSAGGRGRARVEDDGEEDAWSDGFDDEPAKKKRKTLTKAKDTGKGKGKGKGRKGKLSAFSNMPMDVLVEISRHLDPLTLLYMSRANKALHGIFASRSAAPIWNIVRNNVELPSLTAPDMSDMQYASLVFEHNCHLCGKGRASIVDFSLRVRWCKNCQKANLLKANELKREVPDLDGSALACSLSTFHSRSGRNWNKNPYFCKPDVVEISDELAALKDDIFTARGKVKRDEAECALAEYMAERKEIVKAAKQDAEELDKWARSSVQERKKANVDARAARRTAIVARLVALGYDQRDTNSLWAVRHLIDQPAALTDAVWNRISPQIIKSVESNRDRRLQIEKYQRRRERRLAIQPFYDDFLEKQDAHTKVRFPSFASFAQLPSVEPLWHPDDATVDQASFDAAIPAIEKDVEKAIRALKVSYARSALRALVLSGSSVDVAIDKQLQAPPPLPDASLSSTADPSYPYGGDYEISHSLLNLNDTVPSVSEADLDAILSRLTAHFRYYDYGCYDTLPYPLIHKHLRDHHSPATGTTCALPTSWIEQLERVLETTGFADDEHAQKKLEDLGAVWECKGCENAISASYGMSLHYRPQQPQHKELTWDEMVPYFLKHHSTTYGSRADVEVELMSAGVAKLSEAQQEKVEQLEAARKAKAKAEAEASAKAAAAAQERLRSAIEAYVRNV
ncbi:hypothetical protein JCM10213_002605 [Rhodosporidiobolus nylandii]